MAEAAIRLVNKDSMNKGKALDAALEQIERSFGKGSIMKFGQREGGFVGDRGAIARGWQEGRHRRPLIALHFLPCSYDWRCRTTPSYVGVGVSASSKHLYHCLSWDGDGYLARVADSA